jgi:hypothetical protein
MNNSECVCYVILLIGQAQDGDNNSCYKVAAGMAARCLASLGGRGWGAFSVHHPAQQNLVWHTARRQRETSAQPYTMHKYLARSKLET